MTILIFLIVSYILLSISLYLLFPKINIEAWKGLVPGLNFMEWAEAIGRPKWWAALLLIPIVNIFIFCGMAVDLVRSFNKLDLSHSTLAVVYAPAIFTMIARNPEDKFQGAILDREREYFSKIQSEKEAGNSRVVERLIKENPYRKSGGREWFESIVFAVFAAAFIRMFLIEAYVIPTGSMEGSLLVGDFLFVSKAHYGIRPPMTVAMVPLLHNVVPFLGTESYIKNPSLPYTRLKALEPIDLADPIVFNWPIGDSVYIAPARSWALSQIRRNPAIVGGKKNFERIQREEDFRVRPIDKRDHYIKRCVGTPGDVVEIKNNQVYINGKVMENPSQMQLRYLLQFPKGYNLADLDKYGIDEADFSSPELIPLGYIYATMTKEQLEKINELPDVSAKEVHMYYAYKSLVSQKDMDEINKLADPIQRFERGNVIYLNLSREEKLDLLSKTSLNLFNDLLFPHDQTYYSKWTVDNYGPITIPKKGETVELGPHNISLYERVINVYDNNEFRKEGDKYFINGEETKSYTFKQDYYWAMGDNRHASEDSRMWGFVPHDHIVGKPLFIWFSTENGSISNGIRWNRIFKSADIR